MATWIKISEELHLNLDVSQSIYFKDGMVHIKMDYNRTENKSEDPEVIKKVRTYLSQNCL